MKVTTPFERSNYAQDQFETIGSTNSFRGSIAAEPSSSAGRVTKIIDQTIRITTVADTVRQRACNYWGSQIRKADCGVAASAITLGGATVGVIGGSVVLGVCAAEAAIVIGASLLAVAAVVGIVAVVALGVSLAFRGQYQKKLKEWKDPAEEVAHHRREAEVRGYPYLRAKSDLRLRSFAPAERTTLALRTMDGFLRRYQDIDSQSDAAKVQFVDDFFTGNPLLGQNREDAFGSNQGLAENMVEASRVFGGHERSYRQVVAEAQSRHAEIDRSKQSQLLRANTEKMALQNRLSAQRERALARCRAAGSRVMLRGGGYAQSYPNRSRGDIQRIDSLYNMQQMQLEVHFSSVRRGIIENADTQTRLVNDWVSARKQLFVHPIGQILGAFVSGRELDQQACEIPREQETPPPASVTYIFPSFDLSELEGYEDDGLCA